MIVFDGKQSILPFQTRSLERRFAFQAFAFKVDGFHVNRFGFLGRHNLFGGFVVEKKVGRIAVFDKHRQIAAVV